MGVYVGGLQVVLVGNGSDYNRAINIQRFAIDSPGEWTRRRPVDRVSDLGIFCSAGKLKVERLSEEAPIHAELGVFHKSPKGLSIKRSGGWDLEEAALSH